MTPTSDLSISHHTMTSYAGNEKPAFGQNTSFTHENLEWRDMKPRFSDLDLVSLVTELSPYCYFYSIGVWGISHDSSVGELMSLTVCPLYCPGYDSSVRELMYLTVCPPYGTGRDSSVGECLFSAWFGFNSRPRQSISGFNSQPRQSISGFNSQPRQSTSGFNSQPRQSISRDLSHSLLCQPVLSQRGRK